MSILSKIFTGPESAGKAVDAVISAGDKVWFTDEEKAENRSRVLDWYLKYLESTQPQNLARRVVAFIVVLLWAGLVLAGVLAEGLGAKEYAHYIFQTLDHVVNEPFMVIIGFYYLAHVTRSLGKKAG